LWLLNFHELSKKWRKGTSEAAETSGGPLYLARVLKKTIQPNDAESPRAVTHGGIR